MSSRFRSVDPRRSIALAFITLLLAAISAEARTLRICADPNNLPFTNRAGEGFENEIARLLAKDLGAKLEYTWWAQRRGFVRNTLRRGSCDVILGVPSSFELALTTKPYYRSTYVFVTRRDRKLDISSFDDPRLRTLRVAVPLIGDDYANAPPAHALAKRGIVDNVVGYSVYGNYVEPSPPARIIEAVANRDVDVAIAWGPMAAYFAGKQKTPLTIAPVSPQIDLPFFPFVFDISMGVRRGDEKLKNEIEAFLDRRGKEIDAILDRYGVPRV